MSTSSFDRGDASLSPRLPASWASRLTLPVVSAPMFLASGPDLVVEACRAGVVGTFPALNQRSTEAYDAWLTEIESRLDDQAAPFGVNLIVHGSNERLEADLDVTVRHRVPLVITSLGAVAGVVDAVHSYGGVVFHDVINVRHARKAVEAGVDGIIAVCAGAGGHGGALSPFALVPEIRRIFDGIIVLSGSLSSGADIAAAQVLGADLAYLGTRFLATEESMAPAEHKQMIVASSAVDVVYTDRFSVANANYLRPSIVAAGLDPENLPDPVTFAETEVRAWRDIWSAGHGVGSIDAVPSVALLCHQLSEEFDEAIGRLAAGRGSAHAPRVG